MYVYIYMSFSQAQVFSLASDLYSQVLFPFSPNTSPVKLIFSVSMGHHLWSFPNLVSWFHSWILFLLSNKSPSLFNSNSMMFHWLSFSIFPYCYFIGSVSQYPNKIIFYGPLVLPFIPCHRSLSSEQIVIYRNKISITWLLKKYLLHFKFLFVSSVAWHNKSFEVWTMWIFFTILSYHLSSPISPKDSISTSWWLGLPPAFCDFFLATEELSSPLEVAFLCTSASQLNG